MNDTRICANEECSASIEHLSSRCRFCSRKCLARFHHKLARADPEKRARENARHARYSKANPEKRAASASDRYRRRKPDARPYRKRLPPLTGEEKRLASAEYARRRYARVKSATVVPFTVRQLHARLAYWGNRCWMCGSPATCVDHVKPLIRGGPHLLANLRPACKPCNSTKQSQWFGVAKVRTFVRNEPFGKPEGIERRRRPDGR